MEKDTIYFVPRDIPCPHCGVRIPLQHAVSIVSSDEKCPTCGKPLTQQDVGRYCGKITDVEV